MQFSQAIKKNIKKKNNDRIKLDFLRLGHFARSICADSLMRDFDVAARSRIIL